MSAVLKEQCRNADAFVEHRDKLRRHLRRKLCGKHQADIEDLLQDICIRYLLGTVEPEIPLAFLYQIANHVLADYLERKKQWHDLELEDIGDAIDETAGSSMADVERGIDLDNRVARMLAPLPCLHRAILILHKMYGYSYQDVADELDLSIHTVEKWITEAKFLLRGPVGRFADRDVSERDAAIIADREAGMNWNELSRKHGITNTACGHIYRRKTGAKT